MNFDKFLIIIFLLGCFASCSDTIEEWDGTHQLSVMSFNIRYDTSEDEENNWNYRREPCVAMLHELSPDIIGIQEGLEHQVYYLNEQLNDYDYVGVGRDDGEAMGEYCAIYFDTIRFSKVEAGNFWLSETPETPSMGWDAVCNRIVTWVHLENRVTQERLYVFNTHFDHKGNEAQVESGKLIVQKIEQITQGKSPVFITGDFNVLSSSKVLNPILEKYNNARNEAQFVSNGKSFNAFGRGGGFMNRNIDFIFHKNPSPAVAFKTITASYGVPYLSDHYPIIAYF